MQPVLGEFGTEEDEAQMPVRRYGTALVSFGEEAVFTMLDMVPERVVKHSGEGDALLR
jgi:hypothetical protein